MKDPIERQDAIDALCELYEYMRMIDPTEAADLVRQGVFLAEQKVENLPSAQPERKTGKWEIYIISMLDGEGCKCSECGFEGVPYWDFCPNCGADMRGE